MSEISKHVMDAFLSPGLAVWGEPSSPDPERFLREYSDVLKGYPTNILEAAYRHLRQFHKGPTRWPRIPECVEACADAQERIKARRRAPSKLDAWNEKANNAERLMMNTELGQQSARDGWAGGMREFIMETGRLPQEHEIGRLIANARFIDECAAGEVHMGLLHESLLGMSKNYVGRRESIAFRVVNGIERADESDAWK